MSLIREDLLIEPWPPKKSGGMQVRDMRNGVKVTHLPTGNTVCSLTERSQHKNRAIALDALEYLLLESNYET